MAADNPAAAPPPVRPRQSIDLTEEECWSLLGGVSLGRIVFTKRAMPAIRPVNHIVDDHTIIIRTHLGASIVHRAAEEDEGSGAVVCYEADALDPVRHTGWSVIVTGLARLVTDPARAADYSQKLEPWVKGEMDQVVSIEPRFVSGIRLVGWCG